MNDQELDALAKRVVDEQEARKTTREDQNPNQHMLDALGATKPWNQGLSDMLANRGRELDE